MNLLCIFRPPLCGSTYGGMLLSFAKALISIISYFKGTFCKLLSLFFPFFFFYNFCWLFVTSVPFAWVFFFFLIIIEYNPKTLFSSFEWRTLEAFKTVAFITTTVVGYEYFNKVWKQPSKNTLLKGARVLKKCFKFLTFSRNWTALGECFQQLDFQVLFNKLFYVPF